MTNMIDDKSIEEWKKSWEEIGMLTEENIEDLKDVIGVFAVKDRISNKIYGIGVGTEIENGGLRKRLMDFIRPNDSARSHYLGKQIHKYLENIKVVVIPTRNSAVAYDLRDSLIEEYQPEWNQNK